MKSLLFLADKYRGGYALFGLASFWSLISILGVRPLVMGDELRFSTWVRHTSFSDQPLPDYLFTAAYKTSLLCGDGFYQCVKAQNWVFTVGAAVILVMFAIYLGIPKQLAWTVGAAVVFSPQAIRASFFMSDSMFYFLATASIYLAIRLWGSNVRYSWMYIGLALGATILTKPHGWFVTAALLGAFLLLGPRKNLLQRLKQSSLIVAVATGLRFIVGFVLAGPNSFTVFGGYTDREENSIGEILSGQSSPAQGWEVVNGYAVDTFLAYMVGGVLLLPGLITIVTRGLDKGLVSGLSFSPAKLLTLVYLFLSAVFSAFVWYAAIGGESFEDRVIFRYVEFLIPLILIVIVASYMTAPKTEMNALSIVAVFSSAGLGALALFIFADGVNIRYADSAFTWLFANQEFAILAVLVSALVAGLQFLGVASVVRRVVVGSILALIPALGIYTSFQLNSLTQNLEMETKAASALQSWNRLFPAEDIQIISNNQVGAQYIAFLADTPDAAFAWTPEAGIGNFNFDSKNGWLLNASSSTLDSQPAFRVIGPGFSIDRFSDGREHFFGMEMINTPVSQVRGLEQVSDLTAWAPGLLEIELEDNLRPNSQISLRIAPSSSSVGAPLQVSIGSSEFDLILANTPGEFLTYELNLPGDTANLIKIEGQEGQVDFGILSLEIESRD